MPGPIATNFGPKRTAAAAFRGVVALALQISCAQSTEEGEGETSSGRESADASEADAGSGSETAATLDCPGPVVPDVVVSVSSDGDGEMPTVAGSCEVSSVTDAETLVLQLACLIDGAAQDIVVTLGGVAGEPPSALEQGESVDMVFSRLESLERGVWISLSDSQGLVLAAASGSVLDADFRGEPSQGIWSPMLVSSEPSSCETGPSQCNTAVQRAALRFSSLFAAPVDVFDHASVEVEGYRITVGNVLLAVGTGTCDGASGSWFDFVVVRGA